MIRNQAGQRVTFPLFDSAGALLLAPTLAAADFRVDIDGGGQNPVAVTPTSDAAGLVTWLPSQAETNGRYITLKVNDAMGAEWLPVVIAFDTLADTASVTHLDATVSSRAVPGDAMSLTAGALAQIVAGIQAILCTVWSCATRTLTTNQVLFKGVKSGANLQLVRGDTLSLALTGLGDLTTATELWFTVKQALGDADTAAEIQITLTGGLTAIAGGVATVPLNGSIAITDLLRGNITITLAAVEMAKLDIDFVGYWDLQKAVGPVITTLTRGNAQVLGDTSRSV